MWHNTPDSSADRSNWNRMRTLYSSKLILILGHVLLLNFCHAKRMDEQIYIVFVTKPAEGDKQSWYGSFLQSKSKESQIIFKYSNVINGFAIRMTEQEAKAMENKEGFVSARPEKLLSLHTTHSPEFLGLRLNSGVWSDANSGKGIIIGVLDSGINPDHPSFSDEGMSPPPAKWKGDCEFPNGICNTKLIGARNFIRNESGLPPFDELGHGTHMAGIAAGNFVRNASVFGLAKGQASGMAPHAHLAIYKVCSKEGCPESAVLAAIDAAIEDRVDIISLSLGGESVRYSDSFLAVGAFAAIERGILVSCSSGNDGPSVASLTNEAPWLLTVGASTIDRRFRAKVVLGDGEAYNGESLFQPSYINLESLPLVDAGNCLPGMFSNVSVEGKLVVCEKTEKISPIDQALGVKIAGGAAMILINKKYEGFDTTADHYGLPAAHVSFDAGTKIRTYIGSSSNSTATIMFMGTVTSDQLAPALASFSSIGPNMQSLHILKPDIIGPGVEILAAWTNSIDSSINSPETFHVLSGTSVSSSHLSGIAALIKSVHPDWSPAAIKSAMMTTADISNLEGMPIVGHAFTPVPMSSMGAGHINPSKAIDPGLVYDIETEDYIAFLCGSDYTDSEVTNIAKREVKCSEVKPIKQEQLNYPCFVLSMGSDAEAQSYTRTVTNVGPANSTYSASVEITESTALGVEVRPSTITFSEVKQKVTYTVKFFVAFKNNDISAAGYLRWISDTHSVTIPISVNFF